MKLKICVFVMGLCFTVSKGEDLLINAFQSLIQKQPMCISLVPDTQKKEAAANFLDVHILSRFLKKLATGPCLMLAEDMPDQTLLNGLFPKVEMHQVSPDMRVDALINKVLNFSNAHGGYVAVLTHLPSREQDIQIIRRQIPQLCYLAVDGLLDRKKANIQLDLPKLLKLMKRNIRVVCTAALIPIRYEQRKKQYIHSLNVLKHYAYDPYVAESCAVGPTFFDEHCNNVCYTVSNNPSLHNKGVNESVSLLKALERWDFDDEDIILKLTGRYVLQSDALIRLLEDTDDIAAVAKFEKMNRSSVLTGCFAMRCDLMKQMYAAYDYEKLEREMICIEHEVGPSLDRLEKKGYKIVRLAHLGVAANVFANAGTDTITYW